MSEDEQMIARGRLMTDYAEAKRQRTLLQAERDRLGKLIATVGTSIQGVYPQMVSTPTDDQLEALDQSKIRELLNETRENDSVIKDLRDKLKQLGLLEDGEA